MTIDSFEHVITVGDAIPARAFHRAVVQRGTFYFMMGRNATDRFGDILFSNDGRRWRRRPTLLDTKGRTIAARDSFGLVKHGEKVYLMGGWNGRDYYNDVYVTNDMVRFERMIDAPWSARYGFCCFSHDGRIWVMAGKDATANRHDVWWTRNGVTWKQEPDAPWPIRVYAAEITYSNRMYVIGGYGANLYNDVQYSYDGRHWTQMEGNAAFSPRFSHAVCQFGDGDIPSRMVLVGGQTGELTYSDDLWHSGDGHRWKLGDDAVPMGTIRGHTMNWFDARLFVIGGVNGVSTYRNQVYASKGQMFRVDG
jgi:hypothetical protein